MGIDRREGKDDRDQEQQTPQNGIDPLRVASDGVRMAAGGVTEGVKMAAGGVVQGVGLAADTMRLASLGLRKSQRRLRRLVRTGSTHKTGLPPGTLVYTGEQPLEERHAVNVRIHVFDADGCDVVETRDIAEIRRLRASGRKIWVDVDGIHDIPLIEAIGEEFGIHPLTLEDIARSGQRAKTEEYDEYLFLVMSMLRYADEDDRVDYEQIGLVLGEGWLLSFQERQGDVFDAIRQRMQSPQSKIRAAGIDYLMYRLVDTTVDYYFVVLERLGDQVAELETELLRADDDPDVLGTIHVLKQESLLLRRAVWPLREMLVQLERRENAFIAAETRVYIRDVYDHAIEVIDTVETIRDLISGMLDVHLTNVSNRMNEVMKVLTIIATIFVPLTFIVGVYGMNFEYMPELNERWAYPLIWAIMIMVTVAMLIYFRRKRWL